MLAGSVLPGAGARADEATGDAPAAAERAPVEELVVRARRPDADLLVVPRAITELDAEDVRAGRPQLSLAESLALVPGVFVQNRTNFAQDSRISIRGFGARANFGLRGIRLYVDGVPQTLPDGQGQVDSLSLPTVGRIEVMRGPASTLYGPAAGGVILVETERPGPVPTASGHAAYGSYGYQSYDVKGSAATDRHDLTVGFVHQRTDGYRDHAEMQSTQAILKSVLALTPDTDLITTVQAVYSPIAEDPGGLDEADARDDPTQAWSTNVTKDAGESVTQATAGLGVRHGWSDAHETTVRGFFTWRGFDGRLPTTDRGVIELDRLFGGASLLHVWSSEIGSLPHRLVAGVEGSAQRDDRQRWQNLDGGVKGQLQLDQDEDVSSVRAFVTDEWSLPADLTLSAGVSYDHLFYAVDDHLQPGGNDGSGERDFGRASPMAALGWAPIGWANPYFRYSTSFEPPTTTELGTESGTGFNPDLEAQKSQSWELGVKGAGEIGGLGLPLTLHYELTGYHIEARDEIVPQETNALAWYANAGHTRRSGLETLLALELVEGLESRFAYAFGVSKFVDYVKEGTDYSGNRIPGIPDHVFTFDLRYRHSSGLWGAWETRVVSAIPTDDANSAEAPKYTVHGLRVGWTGRLPGALRSLAFSPWVGIENLTDAQYIDNVKINAFGSRYFEPAPGLAAQFGARLTYHFGERE